MKSTVADTLLRRARHLGDITGNAVVAAAAPAYSRLLLMSDGAAWSISWDVRELETIARALGIPVRCAVRAEGWRRNAIFYGDQSFLLNPRSFAHDNRIGFAYFHGKPSKDEPVFTACYEAFTRNRDRIARVQVTNRGMRDLVLESGIEPARVFVIPIGINPSFFVPQTLESRRRARARYGIPTSAVVVGSFQKDGVGWGDGREPKRVKGPDVFLQTMARLKTRVPELFVLLSGPSRGYVKQGLDAIGVPYRHFYLTDYPEVGQLFQALDLYVVASRDEGGPKAVLESMATGVPLVTTRVGQAVDLVRHGENGWLADVEDVDALAHWAEHAIAHRAGIDAVLRNGRRTAEDNSYAGQLDLWRSFFAGFVGRA